MSFPDDATGTFEGRLGCPSELVLDRHATGELSPRSTKELEEHLAGCDVCRRRIAERKAGFSSLPAIDSQALLARIQAQVEAPAPAAAPSWRRHAWLLLVPLFAIVGALVVRWLLHRP